MRVVELFQSKQGEGLWTGALSTFVRTAGCNLRCSFCDTTYASWQCEEGELLTVEEIVERVEKYGNRHVVLTGGEPLIWSETIPLTEKLGARNFKITIETAGTIDLQVRCDLISISPKLSNSTPLGASEQVVRAHETNRNRIDVVRSLVARYPYQLKFVVDLPEDLLEIEEYLQQLGEINRRNVLLMPMATDVETMRNKGEWIAAYAKTRSYRYCPRMQLEWYGNRRGT